MSFITEEEIELHRALLSHPDMIASAYTARAEDGVKVRFVEAHGQVIRRHGYESPSEFLDRVLHYRKGD